ncbi:DUF4097 family beta strand repeat-containing protein [Halalkalibacter oceani]|uniref:DUF4097 domain-containing protein n=1 Tax=Halalkalibacter oceani TaxID=1653776 RepID=A0A9X2DSH6_9BACI|nr:DUF4097 domain-containing protein [Halalkalibacter oceani]MCM3714627.1 DUF4097 domain-containing protein [Halalkalibacter oceani]
MEERKMILKMIEDGKITAEEGLKLLEAIDKGEKEQQETGVSTKVNWDEGESYRKRARQTTTSAANMFTSFIESTIQKIKDVDLDFNFGPAIEIDHIFQHRESSPTALDISLENGSLSFQPWDEPDVRIECQAKVYRVKDSEEARRFFLQQSTFRVNENKLMFHTKTKSMKVQATVYVPRTTFDHIKLYTFNGQINGKGIDADTLDVNAMNGAISFEQVQAKKVIAETVNGAIEYKDTTIDVIDVKTINGGITLAGTIQDLDAETVNGSITYEMAGLTESGYADLKATTGSVHLFVPKKLRVEGKLKTNVGSFAVGLADYEVLEEKKEFAQKTLSFIGNQDSSPRVKINALTNTGSIHVKDLYE